MVNCLTMQQNSIRKCTAMASFKITKQIQLRIDNLPKSTTSDVVLKSVGGRIKPENY